MAERARTVRLCDVDDIFDYPIPVGERLNSHFFLAWHFDWWLQSEFRLLADKDVMGVGLDLFSVAQKQDPVGTLPDNPLLLAKLTNMPLEQWESLNTRPIAPLHNWRPCRCSNGDVRLYHPKVLQVVLEACGRREDRLASLEEDRARKRMKNLPEQVLRAGGTKQMVDDEIWLVQLDEFLMEHWPKRYRRAGFMRQALAAFALVREGRDWTGVVQ